MAPVLHLVPLLFAALAAAPDGRRLPPPARLLRQGRPRQAATASQQALERDPDDPDAMATLAAAWSRTGHHADATAAFELSTGSAWYEEYGIESHADSLRAQASPEAAALHTSRVRMGGLSIGRQVRLWVDIIDDHRAAGDPLAAWDALAEGLGVAPNSPALLAAGADLRIDEGDLDGAAADLWLSRERGATLRGHLAAGRLALHDGHPEEALAWARDARRFRSQSLRLYALNAEALRQLGALDEAAESLDVLRARQHDDPELMAVQLRLHRDRGEEAALAALERRTERLYPQNFELRTTRAALD